jgi:prephenate dehydrogenase
MVRNKTFIIGCGRLGASVALDAYAKGDNVTVIDEKEENLKFYRPYPQKFWDTDKQLKAANEKLERLERVFKRVYEIA